MTKELRCSASRLLSLREFGKTRSSISRLTTTTTTTITTTTTTTTTSSSSSSYCSCHHRCCCYTMMQCGLGVYSRLLRLQRSRKIALRVSMLYASRLGLLQQALGLAAEDLRSNQMKSLRAESVLEACAPEIRNRLTAH